MRTKVVSVRFKDDEFDMYRKLARAEDKNFSTFVRDKLRQAIRQEMKEANLLNRLIRLIEELPERLQIQMQMKGSSGEEFSQVARLLLYLIKLFEMYSEYTIVMESKRKEFKAIREELKRELGVEV